MVHLYHFPWVPEAQRVRLALAYKQAPREDRALDYEDDASFFELGVARQVPILQLPDGGRPLTDPWDMLWRIDTLFPDTPPLVAGCIEEAAWHALVDWRTRTDPILQRLYAPAAPAWRGLGDHPQARAAYRSEIERRFGLGLEALANDRYAGFEQFARLSRLSDLAAHLAQRRFYTGRMSIADATLCADLFPLQLLDGISLPIDLLYYLERVMQICHLDLRSDLLSDP